MHNLIYVTRLSQGPGIISEDYEDLCELKPGKIPSIVRECGHKVSSPAKELIAINSFKERGSQFSLRMWHMVSWP